ncbi:MAG: substrate-binding domain-containing protein, partial [Gammaproteobacteria bacterium]|nr:substrate-binding domain-containing protein [Gammaproteobacteria bacterium]
QKLYQPVRQKMVVLKDSATKPAVKSFVNYIKSAAARKIIKNNGYTVYN